MKYPKNMKSCWQEYGDKRKDLWWLVDAKKGYYLDTFTLCYYGVGQEVHYNELKLLTKKEQKYVNKGQLDKFYKIVQNYVKV